MPHSVHFTLEVVEDLLIGDRLMKALDGHVLSTTLTAINLKIQ